MDRLIDLETGEVLLSRLEVASTFWQRFKGLQFRRPLPLDTGLWLSPCSSLHTCFMRFPIDLVMLDEDMEVVGIRSHVQPWRIILCAQGTKSVIETAGGSKLWIVGQKVTILSGSELSPDDKSFALNTNGVR